MKIQMLKKLLAIQSRSRHEQPMVDWLVHYLRHNLAGVSVTVDEARNVYAVKGNARHAPCVAAHIDTVHAPREVTIVEKGTRLVGYDSKGKSCGIGADDKTGIYVCLSLLHKFDNLRAVFFAMEEINALGAKQADPEFFSGVGCVVEYDCPSRNMLSYTSGGERLFANNGEFIRKANPVLEKHGTTLWQEHPYTDVMALRRRFPISCLNLSSGYYNWHRSTEFVSLPDVAVAVDLGSELIETLGPVHYACPFPIRDDGPPLRAVGPLRLPEAKP